jgi:hypothetical protein
LEAVYGVNPIADVANPQKAVGIADNLVKRRHHPIVQALVSHAEAKYWRLDCLYDHREIIIRRSMPRASCGGRSFDRAPVRRVSMAEDNRGRLPDYHSAAQTHVARQGNP